MSVLGTKFKWMALHALAFLAACTQTIEPDTDAFGFDYYPMRLGDERIYYTQEIFFKLSGTVDTLTYLVKEIVEDTIKQTDGNYQLLLGRYSTSLDTTKWQKDSLWMVEVNNLCNRCCPENFYFNKASHPSPAIPVHQQCHRNLLSRAVLPGCL